MSYRTELKIDSLDDITRGNFKEALLLAFGRGKICFAALGYSGESIVLHGNTEGGRSRLITIRNHSGMAELLITDAGGDFLTLTKFNKSFGDEFISNQFYLIFKLVKDKI